MTFDSRGFPPIRQRKGEWMGHGAFVALVARSFLAVTRRRELGCSLGTRPFDSRGFPSIHQRKGEWMGHGAFVALVARPFRPSLAVASWAALYEQGRLTVEVSHPFAREKANGWGTAHLWDSWPVHFLPSLAVASWAARMTAPRGSTDGRIY